MFGIDVILEAAVMCPCKNFGKKGKKKKRKLSFNINTFFFVIKASRKTP